MQTITFTAQDKQQTMIESLIKTGEYQNKDEVINAALNLLAEQVNIQQQELRSLLEEGLNSGVAEEVDEEEFLKTLKAS